MRAVFAFAFLPLALLVTTSACDEKSPPPSVTTFAAPPSAAAPSASIFAPAPAPAPTATAAPTQIAAQHILVAYRGAERAPSGVTRSKAQAKARAAEADTKAKAGEDFTALVAEYSDDPGAKERLGSLGKFSRDKMDKSFSDAAFMLRLDEVSDVVETRFGFHVIKRNQ
jgi:NIMA-interacting peptidyl-prolyl cis-trans isomerase 1